MIFKKTSLHTVCCLIALSVVLTRDASGNTLDQLSWLVGDWRMELEDVVIEERWIEGAGGLMLGLSRTIAGGDAVGFEFLRIESRGDDVVYVAQPDGQPGTDFTLTRLDGESAVFENPEHDHPKIIRYRRESDSVLRVRIEGDEDASEFEFHRVPDP